MTFIEAALALGYKRLQPWQIRIGEAILRGENVTLMMSRQNCRSATLRIVNQIVEHAKENS